MLKKISLFFSTMRRKIKKFFKKKRHEKILLEHDYGDFYFI